MAGSTLARLAALELAALVYTAAAADPAPSSLRLPESERPIRLVDRLLVNSSNKERFVTLTRGESEGIDQIRELMSRSRVEELWAFLPDPGAGDGGRWVEIGGGIRSESELSSVQVDWSYLWELITRFADIDVYHFHPLSYFERCGPGQRCNEFSVPLSAERVSAKGLINNLKFAMPSPGDIHFMMESSWRFERAHPHTGSMRHRLVTPYGVVEYALTPSGKARYAENRNTRMEGLYIKLLAANALSDENIKAQAATYPDDLGKAVEKLAQSMNGSYLRVDWLSP